ncbi:MAG: TldD/PmbA family protein [Actinomycetota bacterium]|nr:TldD/PmbA family protein [Actinomycetota bacterium]
MTEDLLVLARQVVERASGAEDVEAFVTHERSFQVKAYMGEVENLSSAEPRGAAVRVVTGRKVGFSFTTDLSPGGLDELVAQARENSAYATEDEAAGLAEGSRAAYRDIPSLVDDRQPSVAAEDKVAFALELDAATRGADSRIQTVEESVYADSDAEFAIATSTGVSGIYRRTDAWCYAFAIAADGGDTEVGFEFGLGRGLAALDAHDVARRAASRALDVLGARKIPSRRMPVVFDPYTSGQFLGVIGSVLTGEAVQKGRSLFAGRLGEIVAAAELTLVDDGSIAGAPGSSPWDAEGVPTQRTEIIKGGVLSSFLYDVVSGRREKRGSTGNAARLSFKSPPRPSPSNMTIDPTGQTREQLLEEAGDALLVQDFHGVHSGANAISGDFSVGVTGRLLEKGVPAQPVKEVTIAAPMLDILKGVVAVGDDLRWLPFEGSYGGATTLVSEMTVAGE